MRDLQQAQHLRLVPLALPTSSTRSPATTATNREQAWQKAQEWGDRIPIGILYEDTERPSYEEQVSALKNGPLVDQPLNGRRQDFEALKLEFVWSRARSAARPGRSVLTRE